MTFFRGRFRSSFPPLPFPVAAIVRPAGVWDLVSVSNVDVCDSFGVSERSHVENDNKEDRHGRRLLCPETYKALFACAQKVGVSICDGDRCTEGIGTLLYGDSGTRDMYSQGVCVLVWVSSEMSLMWCAR